VARRNNFFASVAITASLKAGTGFDASRFGVGQIPGWDGQG
jgi:hypothetical protein